MMFFGLYFCGNRRKSSGLYFRGNPGRTAVLYSCESRKLPAVPDFCFYAHSDLPRSGSGNFPGQKKQRFSDGFFCFCLRHLCGCQTYKNPFQIHNLTFLSIRIFCAYVKMLNRYGFSQNDRCDIILYRNRMTRT